MYLIFDLGASHTRIALSSDGVSFKVVERYNTDRSKVGVRKFVDIITTISKNEDVSSIIGGVPGHIQGDDGVLRQATNLPEWVSYPLRRALKEAAGLPVFIENDAALGGLGEANRGAGVGQSVVAYLTVSTGVNGILIEQGRIPKSSKGFEVGQELVPDDSGKLVTWESLIGGAAMEQRYHRPPREVRDGKIWRAEARYLALGLFNLILAWSPDVVVLNGPMMKDISLNDVRRELEVLGKPLGSWPPLRQAELGDEAGLHGALELLHQINAPRTS